jgi:phosphoglycolate phosphatase-like HAD superfamily hydrolase
VDVETVKNADMPLIAVSWGFRSRELLESLGATQIADTVADILQFPR